MVTRRRFLISLLALTAVVFAVGSVILWGVASLETKPMAAEIWNGQYRVELLATGVGNLAYSSDSPTKAIVRGLLPRGLADKLGNVRSVNTISNNGPNGSPQLLLLFQKMRIDGRPADDWSWSNFLERTEIDESTGFTFVNPNSGSSSYGDGLTSFEVPQFPRRDRELHIRMYERPRHPELQQPGASPAAALLMEFTVPNPGWRPDFPVWTPSPLPATQTVDPVSVTIRKLTPHTHPHYVAADVETSASDPLWDRHSHYYSFEDATGNAGQYLSPFEPAWKINVMVRRTAEARFAPAETWTLEAVPIPAKESMQNLGLTGSISGHELDVQYVASAGRVRDEAGVVTVQPPTSPGSSGISTSSGSMSVDGKQVSYNEIESGLPFFFVTQPQLPDNTELLAFVRDQDGRLLNPPTSYSTHGMGNRYFRAISFTPVAETKTVQLTLVLNAGRKFEFFVAPPEEMKSAVRAPNASAERPSPQ